MSTLLALPVAIPLLAAAMSMALFRRRSLQRAVGLVALVAVLGVSVAILVLVDRDGVAATSLGGWPAPIGITLVADRLAAVMLTVAAAMVLAVQVYAVGQPGTDEIAPWFHPVYLVLSAGIAISFLTGDLFNLFVGFEVMLVASYVLLTIGGTRDRIRAGMTYVVISLLSSTLFITAVALVYAATGTVNLAQLAERAVALPDELRTVLWLLLLVVFGTKAAVFPLFFWLPDSYPTAPTPVTAIFAGLLTKVGVYAMIRVTTLLDPVDAPSPLLLAVAAGTMLVGVLGAVAQDDVKRILSFHIISQVGYMVFGLGLLTLAGLAAAIFYIVHHIVVKTALFLVAGLVEHSAGTGQLRRLTGLLQRAPVVAALFAVPALSLAGIPPFSGFVAKLALVEEGLRLDQATVVAVSLVVSLVTLFSMGKIWIGAFWGDVPVGATAGGPAGAPDRPLPLGMVVPTAALVVVSVVVALAGAPLYDLAVRAAADLVDPTAYVTEVLP